MTSLCVDYTDARITPSRHVLLLASKYVALVLERLLLDSLENKCGGERLETEEQLSRKYWESEAK